MLLFSIIFKQFTKIKPKFINRCDRTKILKRRNKEGRIVADQEKLQENIPTPTQLSHVPFPSQQANVRFPP
jgi:hypothetical protein